MKILNNIKDDREYVSLTRSAGLVVDRYHVKGGMSGPYLVAYENANKPLEVNGCPNGSCRYFLVDLNDGTRHNPHDQDRFVEIKTELHILKG